jgi:hypothetical protein
MKKLLVLSVAAFSFISAIKAQSIETSINNDVSTMNRDETMSKSEKKGQQMEKRKSEKTEVSYQSLEQFYDDFGNLKVVKAEATPEFDKITFLIDGAAETAYYDYDNSLVGTIASKTFGDLPENAQNYINRHYGNSSVKAVRFFDDNEANSNYMNIYDQNFEGADSYFVEIAKDNKTIVLHVSLNGGVYFFTELK